MFKGFRFRRGLTIGDFAKQAGIAEERIREWERHWGVPKKAELQDIATAFNTSVFELLEPSMVPPRSAPSADGSLLDLPFYEWDIDMQRRWGTLPHSLWGYLQFQLTPDDRPRWYPVSGEQAASIDKQMFNPGWATMVVAQTLNNRCVMFTPERVNRVSLVDKVTATSRSDFNASWDADGHPPELYRALRAWAQNDAAERFSTSRDLAMRVKTILQIGTTYTRKKIAALVDQTVIHHIDGRDIRFSATVKSLHSAVRSVRLGALTVYLAEHETDDEHLVALSYVRVIDMPATDLELVSNAVVV